MKKTVSACGLFALMILSGCAYDIPKNGGDDLLSADRSRPAPVRIHNFIPPTPAPAAPKKVIHADTQPKTVLKNVAPAAPAARGKISPVMRPGENLEITVWREKDLSGTYQIDDRGEISFPLIGRVKADGLLPSELRAQIAARLKDGYLVKPQVTVLRLNPCSDGPP